MAVLPTNEHCGNRTHIVYMRKWRPNHKSTKSLMLKIRSAERINALLDAYKSHAKIYKRWQFYLPKSTRGIEPLYELDHTHISLDSAYNQRWLPPHRQSIRVTVFQEKTKKVIFQTLIKFERKQSR